MTEQVNAGVAPVEKPQDGVKTDATNAPQLQEAAEFDYAAKLLEKDEEAKKLREERDNYKKGLLKAKGKFDFDEDETDDDKMRRIAREELLSTREQQVLAEKEDMIKKMARELSEAKIALKNRAGNTPSGGSAGPAVEKEIQDNFLSQDQITNLKARGWDDKKIERFKQNLRAAKK